jgi:hypothetical protein
MDALINSAIENKNRFFIIDVIWLIVNEFWGRERAFKKNDCSTPVRGNNLFDFKRDFECGHAASHSCITDTRCYSSGQKERKLEVFIFIGRRRCICND